MKAITATQNKTAAQIITALFIMAVLFFTAGGKASAAGGLQMSTGYPGMTVNAGDDLSFSLDFSNTTGAGMAVSLETVSLPEGWEGYFTGNGSEVSQVYVKSGDNAGAAAYSLSIPDDAASGDYEVVLRAFAGAEAEDTLTLKLKVAAEEIGSSSFESQYPELQLFLQCACRLDGELHPFRREQPGEQHYGGAAPEPDDHNRRDALRGCAGRGLYHFLLCSFCGRNVENRS